MPFKRPTVAHSGVYGPIRHHPAQQGLDTRSRPLTGLQWAFAHDAGVGWGRAVVRFSPDALRQRQKSVAVVSVSTIKMRQKCIFLECDASVASQSGLVSSPMRRLATVREVTDVRPIPDADRIEIVQVGGWQVVATRGAYRPGERCVYVEIDAALPVSRECFAFLASRGTRKLATDPSDADWHVLRTARMRGVYSQGLLLPLDTVGDLPVGTDVTKILGIRLYEPPVLATTSHQMVGKFPTLVRKTDAERVQNLTDHWSTLCTYRWYATKKYDGQSVTVMNDNGQMRVCSRNWEIRPEGTLYDICTYFHAQLPLGSYVQGEYVGPKIQGNRSRLLKPTIFVFGYYDLNNPEALPRTQWPRWVLENSVPVLNIEFPESVDAAIEQASGLPRNEEGIVWHTTNGVLVPELDYRECFKAINNKYLLD